MVYLVEAWGTAVIWKCLWYLVVCGELEAERKMRRAWCPRAFGYLDEV